MNPIVRTLLTLLMALTLNASMALAATAALPVQHMQTQAAGLCGHHAHQSEMPGDNNQPGSNDCAQRICTACTGLPLTSPATLDLAVQHQVEPLRLVHWTASSQPPLFRPPIQT